MTITHGQARRIASEWHGGMSSPLYSLSSTGYVDRERLLWEIDGDLDWCRSNPATEEGECGLRELPALREYVRTRDAGEWTQWASEGQWHRLWDEAPV